MKGHHWSFIRSTCWSRADHINPQLIHTLNTTWNSGQSPQSRVWSWNMLMEWQQEWSKVLLCIRNDWSVWDSLDWKMPDWAGQNRSVKGWPASAWITTERLLSFPSQGLESTKQKHLCSSGEQDHPVKGHCGCKKFTQAQEKTESGNWVLLLKRKLDLETAPSLPLLNHGCKSDCLAAGELKLFRDYCNTETCW